MVSGIVLVLLLLLLVFFYPKLKRADAESQSSKDQTSKADNCESSFPPSFPSAA